MTTTNVEPIMSQTVECKEDSEGTFSSHDAVDDGIENYCLSKDSSQYRVDTKRRVQNST
jgi:hypothetical protein